jgi:4-hydroxythreonine-4-phosphate dehydrogenase
MGDPAGVGPDIALASWCAREAQSLHPFVLYGSPEIMADRARQLGLKVPVAPIARLDEVAEIFAGALPVKPGRVAASPASADDIDRLVISAIEDATEAVARGEALALVTNPIAKKSLRSIPLAYPGHTAFLGQLAARFSGGPMPRPVMMMASDKLKVVPATVHIPLIKVPEVLTRQLLVDTIRTTARALERDFGIGHPRIAVAGLNPHAGEAGLIGTEEAVIIEPAIEELASEGYAITGPHSADTMFHDDGRSAYDVAIAMYHDQALIPLKTLSFDNGVNVTLGLPFVRTSPDHGTAYALAGTGKARPDSLIAAMKLATQVGFRRTASRSYAT